MIVSKQELISPRPPQTRQKRILQWQSSATQSTRTHPTASHSMGSRPSLPRQCQGPFQSARVTGFLLLVPNGRSWSPPTIPLPWKWSSCQTWARWCRANVQSTWFTAKGMGHCSLWSKSSSLLMWWWSSSALWPVYDKHFRRMTISCSITATKRYGWFTLDTILKERFIKDVPKKFQKSSKNSSKKSSKLSKKNCEFRFSIFRIVISVSNVTSL